MIYEIQNMSDEPSLETSAAFPGFFALLENDALIPLQPKTVNVY